MGTELRVQLQLLLLGLISSAALLSLTSASSASAAAPWWRPSGLQGVSLSTVSADGSDIRVLTASGRELESTNGGAKFQRAFPSNTFSPYSALVASGGERWAINAAGTVLHGTLTGDLKPDPGAPALGRLAHLLAAPAAVPGVVVAVADDGAVWRRSQDGAWGRALLLLPTGFPGGVPRVTDVAAFTQPLSASVYVSTDGYAVLASSDGGDDWIRAGPGLPAAVFSLSADSQAHSLYAATSDGLWVHHLQVLPAPPVYRDAALLWRWVGIAVISVVSGAAALVLLLGWARPTRRG